MKNEKGFTLVEVLVASSILSIIITIIYVTFSNVTQSIEKTKGRMDCYHQARILLTRMEKEIGSAFFSKQNVNIRLKGEKGSAGENDNDRLDFVCTLNPVKVGVKESDLMEIGYYIKYGQSQEYGTLVRRYAGRVSEDIGTGGYEDVMGENVKGLSFSYFDGSSWQDSWDTNKNGHLPSLVRISLKFLDPVNKNEYPFSTVVSLPMAEEK